MAQGKSWPRASMSLLTLEALVGLPSLKYFRRAFSNLPESVIITTIIIMIIVMIVIIIIIIIIIIMSAMYPCCLSIAMKRNTARHGTARHGTARHGTGTGHGARGTGHGARGTGHGARGTGHGRGQGRAGQGRAGQGRAGQGRARHDRVPPPPSLPLSASEGRILSSSLLVCLGMGGITCLTLLVQYGFVFVLCVVCCVKDRHTLRMHSPVLKNHALDR